ncbi:hypothetical protein ACERII_21420 [Evansella sp. AB-rgal1]|uniref:hypothetical protein n=1 Tax=Evansella sp. AB-rgal1 TaxID=3242696 RepID=UPI00359E1F25
MKKYIGLSMLLLLLMGTACNDLDTPEVQGLNTNTTNNEVEKDWAESLFGPGPANYGAARDRREPSDPITESNYTGKSYRDPVHEHPTEGQDQDRIENVIYDMPGVTPGMVIIMGSHAWVNVTFEDRINGNVQEDQVREIEEKLREAMPRYNYEIIVNNYS